MNDNNLLHAEVFTDRTIGLFMDSISDLTEMNLTETIKISDSKNNLIAIKEVTLLKEDKLILVHIEPNNQTNAFPYTIEFNLTTKIAKPSWRYKDFQYAYDGKLGLTLAKDGSAELKLWSPSAESVNVILYDKNDQNQVIADNLAMTLTDRGVWTINLNQAKTGIADLTGYFYHFAIERAGETILALDPYAKSLATWDSTNSDNQIGKAAIVDPSTIGPGLDYAKIKNYHKREDAIIYEVHVRDFTSDPSIESELKSQFGTFTAFIEKLDYIQSLGVTHIQLLPVMSYLFANEFENAERLLDYSSENNNLDYSQPYQKP